MASIIQHHSLTLVFAFLLIARPAFSADSPESSPSPSPLLQPGDVSPSPATPSPSPTLHDSPPAPSSPSPSPTIPNSPPAPPPSDLAPNSPSPAPSSGEDDTDYSENKRSPSPSPAPAVVGDINHEDQSNAGNLETKDDSSGGMSGGQKAGVTVGVIAAACVVGFGALVYKKRQENIRRAQYGHAARREFL
ncbi:hypothetical protein CDL12_09845 [Handroanthus impetiginosus]|uniref:Non-specific serine/threonine protein kinase n=1 Tax=Handroanthus impetiginosus TaxID=429701 RepID=A0A2G9HJ00_9LAMI|nr:hypothetical protein CDL12_09845 [Handroanthus impetiginosus]